MSLCGWGDVVCNWLNHPRSREIWCPVSSCRITVSRERRHFGQGSRKCSFPATCVGTFAFKRSLPCNDDRSLPLVEKICDSMGFRAANRLQVDYRELKIEVFSGRRRRDWQSNPGTEVAVASLQNSNIKIAVNSGGRRLGLPKRKIWLHIKN